MATENINDTCHPIDGVPGADGDGVWTWECIQTNDFADDNESEPGFYSCYETEKDGMSAAVCGPFETELEAYEDAVETYRRYET